MIIFKKLCRKIYTQQKWYENNNGVPLPIAVLGIWSQFSIYFTEKGFQESHLTTPKLSMQELKRSIHKLHEFLDISGDSLLPLFRSRANRKGILQQSDFLPSVCHAFWEKKKNMILGGMGSVRMDPNPTKTCPLGPHSTTPKNIYLSEGSYARDLQAQGAFIPRFFDKRLLSFPFKPILIKFRPLLMHVYNIVTPIHSPPPCIIF